MSLHILASYSIKGGVGKTASAANFACIAAEQGLRTLLVDLDPQGAASFYFRVKPSKRLKARRLLQRREDLQDHIRGSDYPGLDILPANPSYRKFDLELNASDSPAKHLRKLLKPLRSEYDLVLLDCPPGLSLLAEQVLAAADQVLVPTIPTTLSDRTLGQLWDFCKRHNYPTKRLLPFLTMVNYRTRMHQEVSRQLRRRYPQTLPGYIPLSAEIEKMGLHRAPLLAYARSHIASRSYAMMWDEIQQRLEAR